MIRHGRVRSRLITIRVQATANGKFGPLDGPFTLSFVPADDLQDHIAEQILNDLVGFIRTVAAGVSSYNKKDMENSSNLVSYARECFAEFAAEAPDTSTKLENLIIDCSSLPQTVKVNPIWRLDRAILGMLPGVRFIE